jgi:hypothetical protein
VRYAAAVARHQGLWQQLIDSLVKSNGALAPEIRRAIYEDSSAVPAHLAALVRAVRYNSTAIRDEDIAAALAKGASEDEVFEAIMCAAFAAGEARLQRGLAAGAR